MNKLKHLKKGVFDYETLTVKFGGESSKPEFRFIASSIRVPTYTYHTREREDAGGGWYGSKCETVERKADHVYLIIKDGICIGVMYHPYHFNIKSSLCPLDNTTPVPVMKFFKSLNIPYNYYVSNHLPANPGVS